MNQKNFQALVDKTFEECQRLLVGKGGEYAGTEDRLSNFKRGAALTGSTPLQVAMIYLSKHYDSLSTYIRKDAAGEAQKLSEPILGRLDDIINYCVLIKGLVVEGTEPMKINKTSPYELGAENLDKTQHDTVPSNGHVWIVHPTHGAYCRHCGQCDTGLKGRGGVCGGGLS